MDHRMDDCKANDECGKSAKSFLEYFSWMNNRNVSDKNGLSMENLFLGVKIEACINNINTHRKH